MAPMRKSRWRDELEAATTDKDVVNVARDFVALLAREELASLPKNCQPVSIETCEDIAQWALRLVQESLNYHSETAGIQLLREISEFFAEASSKLSELRAPHKASEPASRQDKSRKPE